MGRPRPSTSPIPLQTVSTRDDRVIIKCSKCSKLGRRTCTQQACLKCCTDKQCEGHREQRERDIEKELIIQGQHPLQIKAKNQIASTIKPGLYHEPAFRYLGETLLIWDIRQYVQNPKWRDEAIRKSRRYVESQLYAQVYPPDLKLKRKQLNFGTEASLESRRKRFKRVMNHLYKQSLK